MVEKKRNKMLQDQKNSESNLKDQLNYATHAQDRISHESFAYLRQASITLGKKTMVEMIHEINKLK